MVNLLYIVDYNWTVLYNYMATYILSIDFDLGGVSNESFQEFETLPDIEYGF